MIVIHDVIASRTSSPCYIFSSHSIQLDQFRQKKSMKPAPNHSNTFILTLHSRKTDRIVTVEELLAISSGKIV
jgi:hypothetical protein